MTDHPRATFHPYRVTRRGDPTGPPITKTQHRVLAALVDLCPLPGREADGRAVALAAGLTHGPTIVILRSLVDRRLVLGFDDAKPQRWAPSLWGRARMRDLGRPAEDARRPAPPARPDEDAAAA